MYRNIKRLIDIVLSTMTFIVCLPIFLIVSLIIKLDSKGPVLFKQQRIGLNGKQFTIYKFRSMKTDTPNLATDKLSSPETYITKIGKFLRKSSLDEIPQLLNIIRGDMSIVGPRPALYNQYELIEMREKQGIHSIRPGLTGYAQVMGRDFVTDAEKVAYDSFYLNHLSFLLDCKIIFLTFISVIKTQNIRA